MEVIKSRLQTKMFDSREEFEQFREEAIYEPYSPYEIVSIDVESLTIVVYCLDV